MWSQFLRSKTWHLPPNVGEKFLTYFWARVHKTEGCWLWRGANTPQGYGRVHSPSAWRPDCPKLMGAHRVSYELLVGPIPDGLVLDHKCRTPACVNPAHLEPVTGKENNLRGSAHITHCPQGHAYEPDNRVKGEWRGRGSCKACLRNRNNKRYHGEETCRSNRCLITEPEES